MDPQVGDPTDSATQMGPIVSSSQLQKVQSCVSAASACPGVTTIAPPVDVASHLKDGYYFPPTLLYGDGLIKADAWREEIFGPVLAITSFEDGNEAMALGLANDTVR